MIFQTSRVPIMSMTVRKEREREIKKNNNNNNNNNSVFEAIQGILPFIVQMFKCNFVVSSGGVIAHKLHKLYSVEMSYFAPSLSSYLGTHSIAQQCIRPKGSRCCCVFFSSLHSISLYPFSLSVFLSHTHTHIHTTLLLLSQFRYGLRSNHYIKTKKKMMFSKIMTIILMIMSFLT